MNPFQVHSGEVRGSKGVKCESDGIRCLTRWSDDNSDRSEAYQVGSDVVRGRYLLVLDAQLLEVFPEHLSGFVFRLRKFRPWLHSFEEIARCQQGPVVPGTLTLHVQNFLDVLNAEKRVGFDIFLNEDDEPSAPIASLSLRPLATAQECCNSALGLPFEKWFGRYEEAPVA